MKKELRIALLLFCGTGIYFFVNFQRNAVPGPIFNELQRSLSCPAKSITALGSMFMYIYAVCQLFAGLLADRYGGIRTICAGGLLFCIGEFLFPVSNTLGLLYASRAFTGFGASVMYLSMVKELSRNYPKNFSLIFGLMLIAGFSGAVAANAPFVWFVERFGWRHSLLACAFLSAFLWVCFTALRCSLTLPPVNAVPLSPAPFLQYLKQKKNLIFFLFSGMNFGVFYVIQTVVGKKFLEDFCRVPSLSAGWVFSVVCVLCAVSGFTMALVSRLIHEKRRPHIRGVAITTFAGFLILLLAVYFNIRTPLLAGIFFVFAFSTNIAPLTVSVLTEMNQDGTIGVGVGLMNCSSYVVVAVVGNLTGIMMDLCPPDKVNGIMVYTRNSYLAVFLLMAVFSFVSLIAAWQIPETHQSQKEGEL